MLIVIECACLFPVGSVDPAPSVAQGLNSDTISAFLASQPDGLTADQILAFSSATGQELGGFTPDQLRAFASQVGLFCTLQCIFPSKRLPIAATWMLDSRDLTEMNLQ